MFTVTALYGQPTDEQHFEDYYFAKHLPILERIPNVARIETAKGLPGPDGSAPVHHRTTTLWVESQEALAAAMGSEATAEAMADCENYATGGVQFLTQQVD